MKIHMLPRNNTILQQLWNSLEWFSYLFLTILRKFYEFLHGSLSVLVFICYLNTNLFITRKVLKKKLSTILKSNKRFLKSFPLFRVLDEKRREKKSHVDMVLNFSSSDKNRRSKNCWYYVKNLKFWRNSGEKKFWIFLGKSIHF